MTRANELASLDLMEAAHVNSKSTSDTACPSAQA
jgi:hypothetical protein